MTPERWKRVEELYHAARARPPGARAAYLSEACRDDEPLRRDVESLLNEPVSDDGFVAGPALAMAAQLVTDVVPAAPSAPPTMSGRLLGGYHLQTLLGVGGMGEVYRARDAKLGRDVAIKILPRAVTGDPDRLARFEREARMLAALNHPNICAIYGLEEADGIRFLILELVDGATLADLLARGPGGLSIAHALAIARQLAEALEVAHEKGIIHRDLKPANIKITADGVVKVLDFGLAKAAAGGDGSSPDLTQAVVTWGGTREGVVMGTAAYMSPEQACGKVVDRRTDIWAFGCVLYEMVTGHRPFSGETISETLAAVLRADPDWSALAAAVPLDLRRLLRRCLEKDPKRRLQAIGDARIQIEDLVGGATEEPVAGAISRQLGFRKRAVPWVVAGALAVGLALMLMVWAPWRIVPGSLQTTPVIHTAIPLTGRLEIANEQPSVALSPDGMTAVYRSQGLGPLYLRRLDQREGAPIPGTEGGVAPFFSPDGHWVGFFVGSHLKKVSLAGAVVTLATFTTGAPRGGAWGIDGTIVFYAAGAGLVRVSAQGGTPEPLSALDGKKVEGNYRWPEMLPGGKAVVFTIKTPGLLSFDDAQVAVRSLVTGEQQVLVQGAYARYVPSGHLVYARAGSLLAVPFDVERLQVTGDSVRILDGVVTHPESGAAQFAVSSLGSLIYAPGDSHTSEHALAWADRTGTVHPLFDRKAQFTEPRLSADGRRLAVVVAAADNRVWVSDIARGNLTPLTLGGNHSSPIWTPDDKRITFSSNIGVTERASLFWEPVDGSGAAEPLLKSEFRMRATSWSSDRLALLYTQFNPQTRQDIWVVSMEGDRKSRPIVRTSSNEFGAAFSPNGRFVAYVSDASGRAEVYVLSYPGLGGRSTISTAGGTHPVWARSGRELFFTNGDKLMASSVATEGAFSAATPKVLFAGAYGFRNETRAYDVSPDGQRFIVVQTNPDAAPTHLNLVLNWFEDLRARVQVRPRR